MIRAETKSNPTAGPTLRPSDAGEAEKFRAAVASNRPARAHAMRASVSTLYARLEAAGQGHRMRDLMPALHAAVIGDMRAVLAEARDQDGEAGFADLVRVGYSQRLVSLFSDAWSPCQRWAVRAEGAAAG